MSEDVMIEVDNTTSHASELATAAAAMRGDEKIVQRVDDDVLPDATSDSPGATAEYSTAETYLEPLVLQTGLPEGGKEQYHIAELLQYHDQHFVENVYIAILGRKPSATERARELVELRGGRMSKVEIIERIVEAQEAGEEQEGASPPARRVRIEGLPSPVVRRLSRVPVLGYLLRLGRALLRLPILLEHQQGFEIYALAQQQLIADYINRTLPQHIARQPGGGAFAQNRDVLEAVAMFSDALLDLSNSHADLQAQTQTQVEQIETALTELSQAITTQQGITEEIKREQHALAAAQQEFLLQEQRVIVETQKVVLEELREELHTLSRRQESARAELDAEVRRLQSLADAGGTRPPTNSSVQT